MNAETIRARFTETFGRAPEVITRAPGRVNLIGEHVDYHDGLVLPIAVEQSTWVAVASRKDSAATAVALDLGERASWPIDGWSREQQPHWSSYIAGVAAILRRQSPWLDGFDLVVASDVPRGVGLSSSAALEVSTGLALTSIAGEPLDSNEFVDLCRAAEHEFAGVPCGIMDPTASLLARAGCALLLDCRTRAVEHVPMSLEDCVLLLADSGVRRELADGAYAERQRECAAGLEYFRARSASVRSLRDVSSQSARTHASQMDPLAAARAMHVTGEIERTRAAADALRRSDAKTLGRLMSESHESLRDLYQVSCAELDAIVDAVRPLPGVFGARMTGAGFGGCAIVLARASSERLVRAALLDGTTPRARSVIAVHPGAGASIIHA